MLPLVCQALPIVITAHQVRCIGAWMRFGLGMGWFCLPLAPYWLYGLRACVCFGSSALPHAGTVTGSCGKRNRILFRLQELDVGGPGGRKMFSDAVGRLIEAEGISQLHQICYFVFILYQFFKFFLSLTISIPFPLLITRPPIPLRIPMRGHRGAITTMALLRFFRTSSRRYGDGQLRQAE